MRERCGDLPEARSAKRAVDEAQRLALEANVSPHLVFPDTRAEDWLDCDQCRDCFKPAFGFRPRESVQYAMALSNFDERDADGQPLRFRYGFIASSDNHTARPGHRLQAVRAAHDDRGHGRAARGSTTRLAPPRRQEIPASAGASDSAGLARLDGERLGELLYPGRAGRRPRRGPEPRGDLGRR